MKIKNLTNKLTLNKTTVTNLEDSQLESIRGGYTYSCIQGCEFTKDPDCTVLTCYVC
jgi:natural product precursor